MSVMATTNCTVYRQSCTKQVNAIARQVVRSKVQFSDSCVFLKQLRKVFHSFIAAVITTKVQKLAYCVLIGVGVRLFRTLQRT